MNEYFVTELYRLFFLSKIRRKRKNIKRDSEETSDSEKTITNDDESNFSESDRINSDNGK